VAVQFITQNPRESLSKRINVLHQPLQAADYGQKGAIELKFLGLIVIAFSLTGCAGYAKHSREYDQRIAREKATALMQRCTGYGFKPGTPDFSRCLMAADNNQRAIDAADDLANQQLNDRRTQNYLKCGNVFGCK
jgi:hypothetical protein